MIVFYLLAAVLLGILIMVHELGHFLACKAVGVRVERFSIGFGPRLLKTQRGDTEYALSLIPLGGYVKMGGAEPTPDGEIPDLGPDAYLSKPIGLRAVIVAAGPLTNLLLGFVVTFLVLWIAGLPTLGAPVVGSVEPDSPAAVSGIVADDVIQSVDGEPVESWNDVQSAFDASGGTVELTVRRGGSRVTIPLDLQGPEGEPLDLGLTPFVPAVVGDVMSGSPADRAGLEPGDRLVRIEGQEVRTWNDVGDIIYERPNEETLVEWFRDGETMSATIVPEVGEELFGDNEVREVGLIGIMREWDVEPLPFGEAIVSGLRLTRTYAVMLVQALGYAVGELGRGRVPSDVLGGPVRVVQMATESARWGGSYFFGFMALLSVNLCVINLLPLPILDGGHLLLLFIEKLRGRSLSERALLIWQQIGLVFFISLTIALLYMDLSRGA
ncbi:MAG: RIP metalloprotease RseP [Candidatus Eisenbacteria bacterium]|nr:RIP metalloprotease RseP [Candidatus Eisenbacteria bacterium]